MCRIHKKKREEKTPNCSSPARSGDAIRVPAKDDQSYADISKELKSRANPQETRLEVLCFPGS